MMEVWKDAVGLEGKYQVSNLGRVKSLVSNKGHSKKILVPAKCGSGYFKVTVSVNGIHKNIMVHRMVAMAFIENPNKEKTVNHIDGNKTNNRVDNLEWCSYSENLKHAYRKGLNKWNPSKGRKQKPVYKIDPISGDVLGEYKSIGDGYRSIERLKGTNTRYDAISRCCRGKTRTAHGYMWKFATEGRKK